MRCTGCGGENPAAAKFCSECGAALPAACPQCGRPNPRNNRFCGECGASLASRASEALSAAPPSDAARSLEDPGRAGRAAVEGEHKQVTVLFADVADFTPMAERLDPEECHALVSRCFDLMLREVRHYEGTVCHFLGDGIMALFGAPTAREDHAQSAVRAALGIQQSLKAYQQELQERRGIHFRVRIGLNSGPVVVGTVGSGPSQTYTAIGDTVNLASRIQALAEPGSVLITPSTHRLVDGYFVTHDHGEHPVKGKQQPVRLYEVVQPRPGRSRVDLAVERGLCPLVGRRRELEVLLDRSARARGGGGQIVFVRGEPGIGKSRLLYELKRRLEGEEVTWLEGRCISYGHDIAYFPIIELLKGGLGIEETDAPGEIIRKVEAGLGSLGPEAEAGIPFLKYLLAVDPGDTAVAGMDPQLRRARLFESLRAWMLAAAAIRPLVVVVEDLHWIDPLSQEFLSYLAETVPHQPLLLLLTHRPEYERRFGDPSCAVGLELQSLSEQESGEVAHGLLGADSLPGELQELIYGKAEGNPFFVEEVTKSLLEIGAIRRSGSGYILARRLEEIYVPDTVQDVIMARLDRLPEEPKRALQTASVIGREFTVRLLDRTAELQGRLEEYLRDLKSVELIYERALYPELAYMFKHALTHDVAYHSLLLARRKALHRLVGAAIETLYADRLEEQYERLAYHFERAEAWDMALDYLHRSAQKAMAAFAPQQAAAFYDRALAVAAKPGQRVSVEQMIALHAGRGQALRVVNDWRESIASFQAMLDAAAAAGDDRQQGYALQEIGFTCFQSHRFSDALDYAERARHLARRINEPGILAGSDATTGGVHGLTGNLPIAREVMEEALRTSRLAGVPFFEAFALEWIGLFDHWQGNHAAALGRWRELLSLGHQHRLPGALVFALWLMGMGHCACGEYEQSCRYLRESLELSARVGDKRYRCRSLNCLGWVYMDLCHWEMAVRYNSQGAEESRAYGDPEIIRNAELNLGDCYLALGQWDEARQILETVHRECLEGGARGEEWMKWRYTQHLNASLGELWLARGDAEKAMVFAEECLTTAEATGSRRNIVKGRRLKAEVLLAQGRLAEAEPEIEEALGVARAVGNPPQLWKTLAVLGRLRQAQCRRAEAGAAYQEALGLVEGVAMGLADRELRDTLLASPQVLALREAAGIQ
jgi:class 3 adenylate cyclase/tetratricopeptide (TPR) repeat protein